MAGSLVGNYLAQGTAASRPAAPTAATGTLSFYFATDTEVLSFYDWNDTAWQDVTLGGITSFSQAVTFVIDGGGSAITTGVQRDVYIPYSGTITAVTMLADQTGNITVDLWKDTYANYPPTDADSITAAAPPTISSAVKSQDSTLTGWTTSISAGDIIRPNVDSCDTIEAVTITLTITRS